MKITDILAVKDNILELVSMQIISAYKKEHKIKVAYLTYESEITEPIRRNRLFIPNQLESITSNIRLIHDGYPTETIALGSTFDNSRLF